jgi:hypothetical protein
MTRATPTTITKEILPKPKPVTEADIAGDPLLAALLSNLRRTKEPALAVRLREAVDRIQAARRRNP